MSELKYPDISKLTSERLLKVKSVLQSGSNTRKHIKPLNPRLGGQKCISTDNKMTSAERFKFAQHVLNSSLAVIERWKTEHSPEATPTFRKIIYEVGSVSIKAFYEIRGKNTNNNLGVEKKHLSFIFKLIDVGMVMESITELKRLIPNIFHTLSVPKDHLDLTSILTLQIDNSVIDEPTASFVVLTQVALLKALSEYPPNTPKPASNSLIINSIKSPTGILFWVSKLPPSTIPSKLKLFESFFYKLSNSSSPQTCFHFRLSVLEISPIAFCKESFIDLFIVSYTFLRKKISLQRFNSTFGSLIIELVEKHSATLSNVDKFVSWFKELYQSILSVESIDLEPSIENWKVAYSQLFASFSKSNPQLHAIEKLTTQTVLSPQNIQDALDDIDNTHLSNTQLHSILLGLSIHLLDLSKLSYFGIIIEFYKLRIGSGITEVSKGFSKIAKKFFLTMKVDNFSVQSDPKYYSDLLENYSSLANVFYFINDKTHLVYISNVLLSLGVQLRRNKIPLHIDYWRKSVSIDLDIQMNDAQLSSTLPAKVERLTIALIENEHFDEAFSTLSTMFAVIAKLEDVPLKTKTMPISLIWSSNQCSARFLSIATRTLLNNYPKAQPNFSSLDQQVEGSLLEQILMQIANSSRPTKHGLAAKIIERMSYLYENHDLKLLRAYNLFLKTTNAAYEGAEFGVTEKLLAKVTSENLTTEERLGLDIELQDHQYYIISNACLFASINLSVPTAQQYKYLGMSVSSFLQALNQNVQLDVFSETVDFVSTLSAFLELQGAHEKRAELLKAVIDCALFKSKDPTVVHFLFRCKLDLITSLIYIGYSGTALNDIDANFPNCSEEQDQSSSKKKKSASYILLPIDEAWLKLRHAESLISVGETVKANDKLKELLLLIHGNKILKASVIEKRLAEETHDHFQQRILLFPEICNTLASLCIQEGNLEDGIFQAQKAIHFLQGFLKSLQKLTNNHHISRKFIWKLTSMLITSQMQIAMAYERLGVVREACYFTEEAIKAANSIGCGLRLAVILAFDAEIRVRMGKYEKSSESLTRCQELIQNFDLQDLSVLYYTRSAILSLQRQRQFKEEKYYYALSDQIFSDLKEKSRIFSIKEIADEIKRLSLAPGDTSEKSWNSSSSIKSNDRIRELHPRHSLSGISSTQQILPQTHCERPNNQVIRRSYPFFTSRHDDTAMHEDQVKQTDISDLQKQNPSDTFGVEIVWNAIVRSWVYSLGLQDSIEGAMTLLECKYKKAALRDAILFDMLQARNYYLLARKLLSKDLVFSFVYESAISIPSIVSNRAFTDVYIHDKNYPKESISNLEKALQLIIKNSLQILKVCNATEINNIASLINSIEVYIAAFRPLDIDRHHIQSQLPNSNLVFLEIARRMTFESDRNIVQMANPDCKWPLPTDNIFNRESQHYDFYGFSSGAAYRERNIEMISQNFEQDLLVNIPKKWAVVTVNICPETGNLALCRFEKGKTPFQLNLPLNRHSSRDPTEECFSFDHGMKLLREIIDASNATASIERTGSIKTSQERQNWWSERYDLNRRLKALLKEAEYLWLGGFTGIFSTDYIVPHLFEILSQQFVQILRAYLPSRNWVMGGGRPRETKFCNDDAQNKINYADFDNSRGQTRLESIEIEIEPRVLELFVRLGLPDPGESKDPGMLEDLVYFVLDILQLHGERNAYDEIEMDKLMVNIERILREYYVQAASYFREKRENFQKKGKGRDELQDYDPSIDIEHIVLVVDKTSQSFPWESIPSLRNQSVTRVPSLTSLSELLQRYYDPSVDPVWPILHTNPDQSVCNYVLNPGNDLARTQKFFENKFHDLVGWKGLVAQKPTEKDMIRMLSKGDIFVYMGHGSGQQYIREAKIKKMEQCCPSFLLGCRSGVLTEAGDYEPWGTPLAYMIAGCPMLVANLWDVTDRDIDIFSESMLEKWGVLSSANACLKSTAISNAVTESRERCNLKYLNGAAPVVYGIPLKLKKITGMDC